MTIIRLVNGSDAAVRLSVEETLAALQAKPGAAGFVELPGDDGPIHLRPSGVIALFSDAHKGSAGFRMGPSQAAG
ncbi:MAG: hypothetical protein ABR950_05260 [Candidatus Dormibacteria bacterium]|jgi:hypothetical protein